MCSLANTIIIIMAGGQPQLSRQMSRHTRKNGWATSSTSTKDMIGWGGDGGGLSRARLGGGVMSAEPGMAMQGVEFVGMYAHADV